MKNKKNSFGSWAFLVGFVLAFIVGIFGLTLEGSPERYVFAYILILVGMIVGLFNIDGKEVRQFLITSTVLVIITYMGQSVVEFIPWMTGLLSSLLTLFVPATIVVAVKELYELARQ